MFINKKFFLMLGFVFIFSFILINVDARDRYGTCCASSTSCVLWDSCYTSGNYFEDVDQDGDTDYCLNEGWYDCGNEGETSGCESGWECNDAHDCVICTGPCGNCVDADGDTYDNCNDSDIGDDGKQIDCDDNNVLVYPGAPEDCFDGIDNDCDEDIDGVDEDCQIIGVDCGNNIIDSGEQCDGGDWGVFTSTSCSSFDSFTGGILNCVNCLLDTTSCTGGIGDGSCGDGNINTGEQCEGIDFGPITGCEDFDGFNTGTLSCDTTTCMIDTSDCSYQECLLIEASWNETTVEQFDFVELILESNGACIGESVNFTIFESDDSGSTRDFEDTAELSSNSFIVDFVTNEAVMIWRAQWIKDDNNFPGDDDPEYYFDAFLVSDSSKSEISNGALKVNEEIGCDPVCIDPQVCVNGVCVDKPEFCFTPDITLCEQYNEGNCSIDPCSVGEEGFDGCDYEISCVWDASTGCNSKEERICNGINVGSCLYDEDTNDDCSDGSLIYNWTASWSWAESNDGTSFNPDPTSDDYINISGTWHYDPNRDSLECVNGSNVLPCPAHIQLPFFTWFNILIIVVLIGIIYYFLNQKKKVKSSKKKK